MFSGFSTTGESDGTDQADPTGCGGMEATLLAAVEQWAVGPGVLSAGRHQRELIPAIAFDIEGFGR